MATISPAMSLMLRLSGSFALRGLARAAAAQTKGAMTVSTTTSNASNSMHRLFTSLFALPGIASCYSEVAFVPGTESEPEYSVKVSRKKEKTKGNAFRGLIVRSREGDKETQRLNLFQQQKNQKTQPQDYDVDALLASQQRPLAAWVLFKTFWK